MVGELSQSDRTVGRYLLFGEIGAGGMASVHVGRLIGPAGFSKLVAIKRLHPHLAKERSFVHAFLDEARIAARVNHPNVVSIHDVVVEGNEVLLVMDYVHGRALSQLLSCEHAQRRGVAPSIAAAVGVDLLHGLAAAHTARDERGRPLGLVHRDISPQNVLVGADGVARVLDFGIAQALGRLQTTTDGAIKGKLAYMAPERFAGEASIRVDTYAAAIVIWEMLAGERYFGGASEPAILPKVMEAHYRHLPSELAPIDAVLRKALARDPSQRHASAAELALAIEDSVAIASRAEVAKWVADLAQKDLDQRSSYIEQIERRSVPSLQAAPSHRSEEATRVPIKMPREELTPYTNGAVVAPASRAPQTPPRGWVRFTLPAALAIVAVAALAMAQSRRVSDESPRTNAATPAVAPPTLSSIEPTPTPDPIAPTGIVTATDVAIAREPSPINARNNKKALAPRTGVDAGTPRPDAGTRGDLDGPTDRK